MVELEPKLIADLLRQSMEEGKAPFLSVVSGSMSPLIRQDDQVQLAKVDQRYLSAGDIIVMELESELLTHRYWGFVEADKKVLLVTKGDRPQHFDHPHDAGTLVGLVIAAKRNEKVIVLSEGAGRWLNKGLIALASLDSHLFASPVPSLPYD